jgi:hypothetical protein
MDKNKAKIKDFFNTFTNPSGGNQAVSNYFRELDRKNNGPSGLSSLYRGPSVGGPNKTPFQPPVTQGPVQDRTPFQPSAVAQAPVAQPVMPSTAQPSMPAPSSLFQTPAKTAQTQAPAIPPQWLKQDGSFFTPEEIAGNIEKTVLSSRSGGDIPTLAGNQFGNANRSAIELQGDTARINNARNDIAVGANDPYKVASDSGIAYSPAELAAIEKAYSGIYDPALNTAMAKLEARQEEDRSARDATLRAKLEAEQPYTLGKGDVRYIGDKPIAVGMSEDTGTGAGSTYVAGSNATADAYIQGIRSGTYKPSDIPDEYKGIVAQGMAATRPAISKASTDAVSVINELLSQPTIGDISGIPGFGNLLGLPGVPSNVSSNLAKQLQGMLSIENRTQLKGSGAISDFEFKVLEQAASALGIDSKTGRSNLKDTEFVNQLNKLKLKLEVGPTTLTDDELLYYRDVENLTPEEIRIISDSETMQGFNSVGNTTVSTNTGSGNRPQRNKNPGNVKIGGLADSLAIGRDDQDHLVFPDAETGFKALTMDLTAKVNGGSRYLPNNPTIAQLGKVYAEDPAWSNSVARILGVDPSTPTQSIPITSLAQAIARQEGFYA